MKIKIKSWEKLLVVGEYEDGDIWFNETVFRGDCMREYCNKEIEVVESDSHTDEYIYMLTNSAWHFAKWMIDEMNRNGANT